MNVLMHREDQNGVIIPQQVSLYVAITDTPTQTTAKPPELLVEN